MNVKEYFLRQIDPEMPPAINLQVEQGQWPPPTRREIFPGRYVLDVVIAGHEQSLRQFPVVLTSSNEVTLHVDL